jgi:hypothetical protein
MLLHFVTFARRGSRKFDRTNVFAGAAGKNLFAVVHARHVHLQTLLARELFGTYLTEKGGKNSCEVPRSLGSQSFKVKKPYFKS